MLTTLVACCAVMSTASVTSNDLHCAVNFNDMASASMPKMDYAGVRYGFCCGDCVPSFQKKATEFVVAAGKKGVTTGESLFDPVSGKRLVAKNAKGGHEDYNGVRFYFATAANRDAFAANKEKFGTIPAKVSLFCPVMKSEVKSYAQADSYVDFEGVRYFTCCAGCLEPLKANPSKYVGAAAKAVKPAFAQKAPKE